MRRYPIMLIHYSVLGALDLWVVSLHRGSTNRQKNPPTLKLMACQAKTAGASERPAG
jgi:hypothetical protein